MTGLGEDIRYALRGLRRSPGASAVVVATVAIVMGASTAAFVLARAALLPPPQMANRERVVALSNEQRLSWPIFQHFQRHSRSFDALAVSAHDQLILDRDDKPQATTVVSVAAVTDEFFSVFASRPTIGRTFTAGDIAASGGAVAVISHRLWKQTFARSAAVIGHSIRVRQRLLTVVGVMPADFLDPWSTDVWLPLDDWSLPPCASCRPRLALFGLLRVGISATQATGELHQLHKELARRPPTLPARTWSELEVSEIGLRRPQDDLVLWSVTFYPFLAVILLFVGWANLACHFLGRGIERSGEIAARIAMGGSPGRILRLLLVESLLLSTLGAVTGLGLVSPLLWAPPDLLSRLTGMPLDNVSSGGLDLPTLVCMSLLALTTAIAVGFLPALKLTNIDLDEVLRETGRGQSQVRSAAWWRNLLIVYQVSAALWLTCLSFTFLRPSTTPLALREGHSTPEVIAAELELHQRYATANEKDDFSRRLLRDLAARPGVDKVALVSDESARGRLRLDRPGSANGRQPRLVGIAGDYFAVQGIDVDHGDSHARPGEVPSHAVVNQTLARWIDRRGQVIGRRIQVDDRGTWWTIVAVVADGGEQTEVTDEATVYLPLAAHATATTTLLVRGRTGARDVGKDVRNAVGELSAWQQPVLRMGPQRDDLTRYIALGEAMTVIVVGLAAVILALTALGLHGVVRLQVAGRRRELGVRLAIGARPSTIVATVLGRVLVPLLLGVLLGGGAWIGFATLAGWHPLVPPWRTGLPTLLVMAVVLAAALPPAWRIARRDPVDLLREE